MTAGGLPGLTAARLWAAARFPYLASGIFGAHVIAAPGSGTVAVDESWRLRADPALAAEWTPAQLGSVLHPPCLPSAPRARGPGPRHRHPPRRRA
jgi:hypothetical protein